jgi:succinoglycan biosynthesis transport protein ExoP
MSRLIDRLNGVEVAGEIVRRSDLRVQVSRSAPHPPPPSQTEFLWILLDTLLRRKWTIVGFFLLVVLLVSAASFLMKPKYEAVARIVFNRETANPLGFKDLGDMPHDDAEYSVSLDTQVQILQSNTLAAQVIRELHLDQSGAFGGSRALPQSPTTASAEVETRKAEAMLVRLFKPGLDVSKEKNTRVIAIRYKSTDPKLSADIANAVTKAYIEHNFKMRFQATMQTSKWLTQQLAELATKVQESQQKLVDYQKEHGFVELDDKQNIVMTRLDGLNRELTAAQADRINKEANYRLTLAENAELTSKAEPNALIDRLNAQEATLKTQYAEATVQLGPSNAKVQELNNQLKETQSQINAELHKMSDRVRTQYFEALAREKLIRGAVEEQKQRANQVSESAIEYSLLKRDAESNRQLYEGLLQKLKEAGVSAGMRSSNIEVVDVAEVPAAPTEPNIPRNLVMAALLGMMGGIGLAFLQEKFDRTVRSFHQVQLLSSLPQLGIIPLASGTGSQLAAGPHLSLGSATSARGSVHLVVNSDPMSPIAESYRALVNSILLSAPAPPKIILLTSAITGDGKTATSINVAIVLAKQGKRVLLVDADFRRPSIDKAMRLPGTKGLSTILRNHDHRSATRNGLTSESALLPVPGIPNLFVMPAGPLDAEPSELIGSKAMQDVLQEWSTQFDHIIIDTSPVVLVSDAVRLSVSADSVILVVRSGHTPQEALARAQQLLNQVNAPVLGVVFNAVDVTSPALSYYGRYGYDSYPQQPN